MKHKLLSLSLAIVLILCSLAVPAFAAETATDAAEAAKGKVCRIGDEGTGTYYATVKEALTAAAAEGDTITLISDAEWALDKDDKGQDKNWGNLETDKSVTFTAAVDAGGKPVHTLKFKNGGFITTSSNTLTVKNLKIEIEGKDGAVQAIAQLRGASKQCYDNCIITVEGKRGTGGNFFTTSSVTSGKVVTLNMKNCKIDLTHTDKDNKAWFINRLNDSHPIVVSFENVNVNLTNIKGFGLGNNCSVSLKGNTSINLPNETAFHGSNYTAYISDQTKIECNALLANTSANVNIIVTSMEVLGTYTAPTMVTGASVRVSGGEATDNGIRFTAEMAKDTTAKSIGMLIARWKDISKDDALLGEFIAESLSAKVVNQSVALSEAEADGLTVGENKYTYNVAITNLPDYGEEFAVRSYADYEVGNGSKLRIYSAFDTDADKTQAPGLRLDQVRCIRAVAEAAIADVKSEPIGDYKFEVIINGETKYSCYTAAQYAKLSLFVSDSNF